MCPQLFFLCFAFTGMYFWGMLYHICGVAYDENMCGPIIAAQMDWLTIRYQDFDWVNYTRDLGSLF